MITYHHIGGRNGTFPLPLKYGPLLQAIHLILYDADDNCLNEIKVDETDSWGKVSVFPYCIDGKTGTGQFHLNYHPTTNSMLRFNDTYKDYNYVNNPKYGEYNFGEACRYMRSIEMEVYSLGDALKKGDIDEIDFLSLDVQGAEFEIIEGAAALLKEKCLGIQLEVEFIPLYQNQKLFSEIHLLMDRLGFELLDLGSFERCAPISMPIGFRGHEQPIYGEAVYIKKLDVLLQDPQPLTLYKAAFFSLIYKKMGLCLKILNHVSGEEHFDAPPVYIQLLRQIKQLYHGAQDLMFPKISDLITNEQFQNYYNGKLSHNSMPNAVKDRIVQLMPQVHTLNVEDDSPLETVLKSYHLDELAQTVKEQRLFEARCFLELGALA